MQYFYSKQPNYARLIILKIWFTKLKIYTIYLKYKNILFTINASRCPSWKSRLFASIYVTMNAIYEPISETANYRWGLFFSNWTFRKLLVANIQVLTHSTRWRYIKIIDFSRSTFHRFYSRVSKAIVGEISFT